MPNLGPLFHRRSMFAWHTLLATVPTRIAKFEANNVSLRILKPPDAFEELNHLMTWRPRWNTDGTHLWFRRVIRETAKMLTGGATA